MSGHSNSFCKSSFAFSSFFVMADLSEQRAAVKFCFLLGKNAAVSVVMMKTAYNDSVMGKTQVYQWFSHFKEGEMSIDDKPRSGSPSTSRIDENVEKVHGIVPEDRRQLKRLVS